MLDVKDRGRSMRLTIAIAAACAVLQVGIAPQISLFGGTVNFMIVFAAVAALTTEPSQAVVCGFLAGLFYDLTSSAPVGLMALLLTAGTFAFNQAMANQAGGFSSVTVRMCGFFALAVCALNGLALLLMGEQTSIFWALVGHGLSSAVLTGIVAVPFLMFGAPAAQSMGLSGRGRGTRYKSKGLR